MPHVFLRPRTLSLLTCLALVACASASPEDRQMANALCAQGKVLLGDHKAKEARDVYASAVNRDDGNARAWNGLGVADDLLGKRDEAKDAYQHAADLAPGDLTALNNLAHLYIEDNEPEKAVELLQPYAGDPAASPTLKQNYETAQKAAQSKQDASDNYAELGSYPTDGMAQGHLREARTLLGKDAKDLEFLIVPEVKTGGGIPTFTVKIIGRAPNEICEALTEKAMTCLPHGK